MAGRWEQPDPGVSGHQASREGVEVRMTVPQGATWASQPAMGAFSAQHPWPANHCWSGSRSSAYGSSGDFSDVEGED